MISIAIGNGIDLGELRVISSDPTYKYLIRYSAFARLNDVNAVRRVLSLIREIAQSPTGVVPMPTTPVDVTLTPPTAAPTVGGTRLPFGFVSNEPKSSVFSVCFIKCKESKILNGLW